MYYIYFLPKPSHPLLGHQPWGTPQRLAFHNQPFAQKYVEELRKHHHAVFLVKGREKDVILPLLKTTADFHKE